MNQNGHELTANYLSALQNYLGGAGERALRDAYDLGRMALNKGLGVVEIAVVHHESLASVLRRLPTPEESVRATRSAAVVEAESLSVFEMALRGYREANLSLTRLNEKLKRQAEELAFSNEQLRTLAAELEQTASAERHARLELEHAHIVLKRTQSQLVQSAKLAALGQLVAGVAHEINNPLAFVLNNMAVLQRDTQALHDLHLLYQEVESLLAEHRPDWHARLRAYAEQIDLRYTLSNLERLLARSRDGLKRIQRIVQDLRDFSRLDSSDVEVMADLNTGITSTISIIRGRAQKQRVELELDLAPLPRLTCSPAKINQVVLNLVANAIDACAEGGTVTVRTRAGRDEVEINVLDTGRGIDPTIRDRIFDPFFTTKPLGQGTGLGLSISHQIVEEHGGRIEVQSVPDQGTHFTVHLPLKPLTTDAQSAR